MYKPSISKLRGVWLVVLNNMFIKKDIKTDSYRGSTVWKVLKPEPCHFNKIREKFEEQKQTKTKNKKNAEKMGLIQLFGPLSLDPLPKPPLTPRLVSTVALKVYRDGNSFQLQPPLRHRPLYPIYIDFYRYVILQYSAVLEKKIQLHLPGSRALRYSMLLRLQCQVDSVAVAAYTVHLCSS